MQKLNTWANEIEKNPRINVYSKVPGKPKLRQEIPAAIAFALLVIALPYLPEMALLISEALK